MAKIGFSREAVARDATVAYGIKPALLNFNADDAGPDQVTAARVTEHQVHEIKLSTDVHDFHVTVGEVWSDGRYAKQTKLSLTKLTHLLLNIKPEELEEIIHRDGDLLHYDPAVKLRHKVLRSDALDKHGLFNKLKAVRDREGSR